MLIQLEGQAAALYQEWFRYFEKVGITLRATERTRAFISARNGKHPPW